MNKKKFMAYVLAGSMFLSGCKGIFKPVNKDKDTEYHKDYTSSSTIDINDDNSTDVKNETIPSATEDLSTTETVCEETIPVLDNIDDNIIVSATTNVNLRSSNTASSLRIGGLKIYDTAFKILSCDNNWDLVKYNDMIGYVCRDYLEYTDNVYDNQYKYKVRNDIVLTNTKLNFRMDPNTDRDRILSFDKNTELHVIAEVDNGWLLVKNNGVIGYVHGDYTSSLLDKAKKQYPDLNISALDVKKVVYSKTNLNIRSGHSADYDKIGSLEKYESVRVLEEYDNWYFIMTNEYEFGFINKSYTVDLDNSFVIVDLSEQRLYMYNNDELYYVTPVTTGKNSTPSDIGLFKIYSKETNRYLVGEDYKSFVNYWMPYNRGEGLHDATWRSVFGTENYKTNGSHGCINMPLDITDDIYENVSVGTKVLVHR